MSQIEAFNRQAEQTGQPTIEPPTVLVLEKGANIGDHMLSGALLREFLSLAGEDSQASDLLQRSTRGESRMLVFGLALVVVPVGLLIWWLASYFGGE